MAKIRDILINIKDVVWWSPAINFTEKNKAEKASCLVSFLTKALILSRLHDLS